LMASKLLSLLLALSVRCLYNAQNISNNDKILNFGQSIFKVKGAFVEGHSRMAEKVRPKVIAKRELIEGRSADSSSLLGSVPVRAIGRSGID